MALYLYLCRAENWKLRFYVAANRKYRLDVGSTRKVRERIDPLGKKIIVLVVDQAGWHMIKAKVPGNILIVPQPAVHPELSPVEPMVEVTCPFMQIN